MKHNILVIGGTGKTGSRVVEGLTALGHTVRIGGRKRTPANHWADPSTIAPDKKGKDRADNVKSPVKLHAGTRILA